MEHIHDVQNGVKADEVSLLEWTHRCVRTKLHCTVDVFHGSYALVHGEDSLVDVGGQDAIRNETWDVACRGSHLIQFGGELFDKVSCFVRGLQAIDYDNLLHKGLGVSEVHSNHLRCSLRYTSS